MANLLKSIYDNVFSKNIMGFSGEMDKHEERMPIYPGWFYTAPFGQPRSINVMEVRNFAKSPWVQMVKNTIKKELSIIEYEIVNVDSEDEDEHEADKKKVQDFLDNVNVNGDDICDVITPMMDDVLDLDAGAWVKVYSLDSYTLGEVPVYNGYGTEIGTQPGLVLKPLGQRTLNEIKFADGSTMLRQVDIYRQDLAWYQYSFKNPRTNPKKFYPEEVVYFMMNIRSDSVYGFSPPQAIQQVLELLIQATRWNKDYFKNNAIPDGIVGLPNANNESMQKFKAMWNKEFKGKRHKLLFHNTAAQFAQFMTSARDMEWLEGQKWYFHLVFAVFGMSPTEVGFHENVNQGNQAGQERVTVKNAIKPYLAKISKNINRKIITEILQQEKPKIMFKYTPKDHAEEQIEFDQHMKEIEVGALTVNEYRKHKGMDEVEWGDEPSVPQTNTTDEQAKAEQTKAEAEAQKPTRPEEKTIPYSKAFEKFMER